MAYVAGLAAVSLDVTLNCQTFKVLPNVYALVALGLGKAGLHLLMRLSGYSPVAQR